MNGVTAPKTGRLLWAGFFAIFAAGVGFSVRGGILGYWAADYGFTKAELGEISGGGLAGFGIVIIVGSLIADKVGYGLLMVVALLLHIVSAVLQLCTDPIYEAFGRSGVYWSLFIAMFLFSIANGLCEAVVNPMVATLYPTKKTHYLNILHAGWPGGLIAGGVVSYLMNGGAIGGFCSFPQQGPLDRTDVDVSDSDIYLRTADDWSEFPQIRSRAGRRELWLHVDHLCLSDLLSCCLSFMRWWDSWN